MPRPLSDSWQYFDLLPVEDGKNRQAKCVFCGHKQAAGITRLHQHLLYRCTKISADLCKELKQKDVRGCRSSRASVDSNIEASTPTDYNLHATTSNSSGDVTNEGLPEMTTNANSLASKTFPFQSNEETSQRTQANPQTSQNDISQTVLDWHLARAFFSANIPFDKVENSHFIEFLKFLQPNYTVPKSSRLRQLLLKEQHWDLIIGNESNWAIDQTAPPERSNVFSTTSNITNDNNDETVVLPRPAELEESL